ncbi:hypothetical protein [Streptomyces sp. Ag109_O5-10]|uniref:hypothetical protein n=1 Tax=Streptomyces sp. Ag109_O5-10 TaxID=1855349 RepID=UPI0015A6D4E9|nr:hypothetical protein [Streptomyces sp. Ag109_O5-10]
MPPAIDVRRASSRSLARTRRPTVLELLLVAKDALSLEGSGALTEGDAARITAAEGQRSTAGAEGAEVLMWEMDATVVLR